MPIYDACLLHARLVRMKLYFNAGHADLGSRVTQDPTTMPKFALKLELTDGEVEPAGARTHPWYDGMIYQGTRRIYRYAVPAEFTPFPPSGDLPESTT